jgi:riboflavin kinase / FMN adenylyltransferase
MFVIDSIEKLEPLEAPLYLAIGMFDGVHIGHQAVIEACLNTARNSNGKSGVLTFWPHPSAIIRPDKAVPQIMPLESKLWTLEEKGLDYTIVQAFDKNFARLEAETFVNYLKQNIPCLNTLFVGENFRFGKGRKGDINMLREQANKVGVHVVSMEQCKLDGSVVSSTRIRSELQKGNFNDIRFLLGHPYTVIGKTRKGRQIGRSIGYPTLNVDWAPELPPPYGVYAARLLRHHSENQKQYFPGIANYGIRPTYESSNVPVMEVHLFETTDIGYDTDIAVELIHFIRPEKKFESPDKLIEQIGKDVIAAKSILHLA